MAESKYASISSQLGHSTCEVEDTEEMFWMREADDYQSCILLGNALVGQYRFKDAITVYEKARSIKSDDAMLYVRLGGANLSLFRFDEAKKKYEIALSCGAPKKTVSYPLGIWYYLKGEYRVAADCFSDCLPCGGEMKIAVIYWHTLSSFRGGFSPVLLEEYHSDMDVGHHTAYRAAVSVFCGEREWDSTDTMDNELDSAVVQYGINIYLKHIGKQEEAERYAEKTLENDTVWPCIPYLAAWNDRNRV